MNFTLPELIVAAVLIAAATAFVLTLFAVALLGACSRR
jgi:prepilin-type N-terminal cleavage/methylation domain-containing protein